MGKDKSLLPFGNSPTLTQFQLSNLSKIFKTVYISCKDKSKFDFNANFIEDVKTSFTYAPTAGFVSIFQTIKQDSFFALSVDSPFIQHSIISKLLEKDSKDVDATVAKTSLGIQPMCGIYHRSLEKKFHEMLKNDNHKLGFLLKSSNTNYVEFTDEKPFLNLNHPHEYEEAKKILKSIY